MTEEWKMSLKNFFAERGGAIGSKPLGHEELAYVSGRDPRVWTKEVFSDLMDDVLARLGATKESRVLEVGCASGFLARGLAPRVTVYNGVDLAEPALAAARRLQLPNAVFSVADGESLPLDNNAFDAALCYDVLTNFPSFVPAAALIREMLRVVRPGGRVLVGSIPDVARKEAYEQRVQEVAAELLRDHGPLSERFLRLDEAATLEQRSLIQRLLRKPRRLDRKGTIQCYYFRRADFLELAKQEQVRCEIVELHSRNPYRGYRFNVIFHKPEG